MMKVKWALCIFLALPTQLADADNSHKSPDTTVYYFTSPTLEDTIQIAVSTPFAYDREEHSYPLLIALDGDMMFGLTSDVPRLMSFENSVPKLIVATVLYGDFQSWIRKRRRDFHSENNGADTFLKALESEILPFITSRYRVNGDNKALYGHSSGGVFALYAGIMKPHLFQKILASSPSLEKEPAWQMEFEQKVMEQPQSLPTLFISVGEKESQTLQAIEPISKLLHKILPPQHFRLKIYDGGTHMAVIAGAYSDGLKWLFQSNK